MIRTVIFGSILTISGLYAQSEPAASRSTTERPNLSAPGMQQTLSGVLMDATCSAIADSRSELTKTPRLVPPAGARTSPVRSTERTAAVSETEIPDTHKDCNLKTSTTSFALYSNGKVYMLDRISNQMMQEHMAKGRATSKWTTRTLVGTTTSDDVLTLRSIRK